jgi:dipeptidase D
LSKITSYFKKTFTEFGYKPIIDEHQNVFVSMPATKGLEKLPSILLQAHSDMVGAKNPSSHHDFKKDPIVTKIDNGWIKADNTTLGADDGIGVAMILAIFADKSLKHGPIEALITADEENGLEGIQKFDVKQIKSKCMINLDHEDETEICIGCPGSIDVVAELPFKRESKTKPGTTNLRFFLDGGLGGHSGQAIIEKHINAIKTIFDLLNFVNIEFGCQLINIEKAGVVKNVIPFECACNVNVKTADVPKIKTFVND